MSHLTRFGHYLVCVIVRWLIILAQAVPLQVGNALARALAWLFTRVLRVRYQVADDNLRHAFPSLSPEARRDLIERMWHHLFLMVMEVAHTPRVLHEENWRRFVDLKNVRELVKRLLEDRPVILVTGHFGNFEFGGYMLGLLGFPTHTVARTLDNPFLDRFVNAFRSARGQHIIPRVGGAEQIEAVLQAGGTMAFLADQSAGRKGCFVQFFGRPASTYKAIGLLSLQYDAPIAVVYVKRLGQPMRFEMGVKAILDPREVTVRDPVTFITQWYTTQLEEIIRESPEQYWWIHRRWKEQPRVKRCAAPEDVTENEVDGELARNVA
ncbi:Lipid A biosynthesis lauroyl acyltransferase [Thermogutta terrifontis]|uniref:Lipid A biosynthesis lauroyl acyltransferase n=1 Tax=Thermogutta terrifontis TaxID=1331910 RepID=A0A286RJX5_9BACT|nr:lysophospholipid acyltransferase family protein [Thermogutta terrifontis]ASV76244.1 Lipid A biosynthesis lauroyl acyltransferase [Thermogutta terrifontis]